MHISTSQQIRHARYIDPSVPYHVVTKTLRGQFILAPKKGIRELCAGVLAKAQLNWPRTRNCQICLWRLDAASDRSSISALCAMSALLS